MHTALGPAGTSLNVRRRRVQPVPVPLHCVDRFNGAYYGRPERLREPGVRLSCSAWSFLDGPGPAAFVDALSADLRSGTWDARFAARRTQPTYSGSLVLIINRPARERHIADQ